MEVYELYAFKDGELVLNIVLDWILGLTQSLLGKLFLFMCQIFAQSWRYKPGQYIAGASGCGPPALPYKGLGNGPSSSSAPFYSLLLQAAGSSIRTAEAHRTPGC